MKMIEEICKHCKHCLSCMCGYEFKDCELKKTTHDRAIEERAEEYACVDKCYDWGVYSYTTKEYRRGQFNAYIQGATEQKAIDRDCIDRFCEDHWEEYFKTRSDMKNFKGWLKKAMEL